MGEEIHGLIGRKLGHSYSVQIHRELGQPDYRLYELEPDMLEDFLRTNDIGGLNVTVPYKRTVMPFCDYLSPRARTIGSVNTLIKDQAGRLCGYNTDACGLEFMARRAGVSFEGRKALILGSGGASLTARAVARENGAREIVVVSRSGEDNYGNLSRHDDAEIIINTTPVGMYPNAGGRLIDPADFPQCAGVLDLIYNPRRTALLLRAEELGIPRLDGLPMLVAQAKQAEELFTGGKVPDAENERILRILRRETENIVLVGMPGSGKTSVGEALAALAGREAIDIDKAIEAREGRAISEIFARGGEAEFRRIERELTAWAGAQSGKVIMTGGGAVKDGRNYAPLHQNGRIYHLVRDVALLPRDGRPLSEGADLGKMYGERLPMYARFRDAVQNNDGTAAQAAESIWRDFCENTCD